MMVDFPHEGMIIHFPSTGIRHRIIDVTDKWIRLECIDTGFEPDDATSVGAKALLTRDQWRNWQYDGDFQVLSHHFPKKIAIET